MDEEIRNLVERIETRLDNLFQDFMKIKREIGDIKMLILLQGV